MSDSGITIENWKEYQNQLDLLYDRIPNKLKETVKNIVELEIELTKLEE